MGSCRINLSKVLIILAIIMSCFQPLLSSRPFNLDRDGSLEKNKMVIFQSLVRSPVPSGPSGCTYIPKNGGERCPPLGSKKFASFRPIAVASRYLDGDTWVKKDDVVIQTLQRGPVPPSSCTHIPNQGDDRCLLLSSKNFAGQAYVESSSQASNIIVNSRSNTA